MSKEIHVGFITKKLKSEFDSLRDGKYEDKQLHEFIDRAIDNLKDNPTCGTKIPRNMAQRIHKEI